MENELKQRKTLKKSNNEEKKSVDKRRLQPTEDNKPSMPGQKESGSEQQNDTSSFFKFHIEYDLITILLFLFAFITRIYKIWQPNSVVFDEMHYGKYVALYMKKTFFFDQHPPLGKQLIAVVAFSTGFDGNYNFTKIGQDYSPNVPVVSLRIGPALFGSILAPVAYKILLQMNVKWGFAVLGGLLVILDNALLTQSRFILMEPILLAFSALSILFLLKFLSSKVFSLLWWLNGTSTSIFLAAAVSTKYVGFYTILLSIFLVCRHLWKLLEDKSLTDIHLYCRFITKLVLFGSIISFVYIGVFYLHLSILQNAGPHDSIMTSAFQASLNGGLASITKGQPVKVVHGSQITLRHTHGRTCWLHSHALVYPVRYPDGRGSSHQQQVTCYSFKDVNNWWIVKKPTVANLVVNDPPEVIKDGDEIQLIHGITSRALNSHDVAAAMSPHCQEVSCYIDYNISMPAQIIWKVDIINKEYIGQEWHAITSQVRLIHAMSGLALKFSGKQLPEWGYNQHEIVADKVIEQQDTIWNVEEHRYTQTADSKERELQLLRAEMIPTVPTKFSFFQKFWELQMKMMWYSEKNQNPHMYSSDPQEWPLINKGIAYWVAKDSNAQVHLLGNIVIWYSGTAGILVYALLFIFYTIRQHRQIYDLPTEEFTRFVCSGEVFFIGFLVHYLPYFFSDRTLFLHNYFPALMFKLLLLCFVFDHLFYLVSTYSKGSFWKLCLVLGLVFWLFCVSYIFYKFSVLSYGTQVLTSNQVINLRWKDTWDFILHKDL